MSACSIFQKVCCSDLKILYLLYADYLLMEMNCIWSTLKIENSFYF